MKLSPRLLAQYPKEMTIILQHQFWDLMVTEDRFEVGLSFGGVPERLVVPFARSRASSIRRCSSACSSSPTTRGRGNWRPMTADDAGQRRGRRRAEPGRPSPATSRPSPSEGAEVVRLDRFRKK